MGRWREAEVETWALSCPQKENTWEVEQWKKNQVPDLFRNDIVTPTQIQGRVLKPSSHLFPKEPGLTQSWSTPVPIYMQKCFQLSPILGYRYKKKEILSFLKVHTTIIVMLHLLKGLTLVHIKSIFQDQNIFQKFPGCINYSPSCKERQAESAVTCLEFRTLTPGSPGALITEALASAALETIWALGASPGRKTSQEISLIKVKATPLATQSQRNEVKPQAPCCTQISTALTSPVSHVPMARCAKQQFSGTNWETSGHGPHSLLGHCMDLWGTLPPLEDTSCPTPRWTDFLQEKTLPHASLHQEVHRNASHPKVHLSWVRIS